MGYFFEFMYLKFEIGISRTNVILILIVTIDHTREIVISKPNLREAAPQLYRNTRWGRLLVNDLQTGKKKNSRLKVIRVEEIHPSHPVHSL